MQRDVTDTAGTSSTCRPERIRAGTARTMAPACLPDRRREGQRLSLRRHWPARDLGQRLALSSPTGLSAPQQAPGGTSVGGWPTSRKLDGSSSTVSCPAFEHEPVEVNVNCVGSAPSPAASMSLS